MQKYLRLFPLVAFVLCACGGQSCSCLTPIKGGFPTDGRRHENAMQIRLTQGALDYLNANAKSLVGALLPMGQTFDIPPSCGGQNEVCCLNGQPQMCAMDIDVQSVTLTPQPPNVLAASIRTGLKSKAPIPITINQIITAKCYFAIDTSKYQQAPYVQLDPTITFSVDQTTDLTNLAVATKVGNLDQSMLDITPQSGFGNTLACGAANFSLIKGFIISQLTTQLQDQISQTVEGSLCASCKTQDDCDSFADSCSSGKCMRQGKCLQEVGAAGKLDVGALFASLSPGTHAQMDTLAVLGGYADVTPQPSSGVSLGMIGGGQGDPHNPCVPVRPAPMVPQVAVWGAHDGETEPRDGKPYHFALGVHQSHLNTMAWAAFDAGALCLDVGTPSVALLDSKTLAVLMPSMADLVHTGDAPVFLVMRPAQEPTITIGNGTFDVDMMGNKKIKEPLLSVSVPKFSIDFYVLTDERYVRILTLTGDLTIPISLDVDGMGRIVPLLGDLGKAFSNVSVTNSELLAESPAKLAAAFPMLLGLAVGQVGGAIKPVALPSVMGLNLQLVAIEPTDNLSFVTFFADLAPPMMDAFHATTEARLVHVLTPPTAAFSVESGLDPLVQPRVELALSGVGIDGSDRDLEWSVSFDDGATWSPYGTNRAPSVTDPTLWLQGRHHLLVRARAVGAPATTDPNPVRVDFLVDTIEPAGSFDLAGDEIHMQASDAVSPPTALEYSVDGGAWTRDDHAVRAGGFDPLVTKVKVRDEAGNVGTLEFHGRTTNPSSGGCGCEVGRRPPAGGALAALAALGLALGLGRARRMRRFLLGLLLIGCGHDNSGVTLTKGQLLDPNDEVGRYSDTVASGGILHVSAYDDSLGDLAYAEIDEARLTDPIQWQWVDGVPTDSPPSTPGGYRNGITDAGDDIGLYTSLALASDGTARIAYFDNTNGQLKYAAADGQRNFTTSVVDKLPAGRAGLYASLALDGAGVPSIAYAATGIPDGMGGFVGRLRLATARSASPQGPGDWTIVDLDSTAIPCAGLCAKGQACIQLDPMDPLKKSVCKTVDMNPCPMMCGMGEACIGGACVAYLAPAKAPDLIEGTGLFAQLRRGKAARVIAYYDHEQGDLDLQVESSQPGKFTKALVDGNDPSTDVGEFASAAVGPDDTVYVAYVDAIGDRLLFKTVKGNTAEATPEVIDDGMRMDGPHPVGGGAAVWTDGQTVRVVYQDQQTSDLWQAVKAGNGAWSKMSARAGSAGYGFYPHVVSDGGKLFLTEFVYDRAQQTNGASFGALQATELP